MNNNNNKKKQKGLGFWLKRQSPCLASAKNFFFKAW
jgi:hypothetical protein